VKTPHETARGGMKIERDRLGRLFLRRTIATADAKSAFEAWQSDLLRVGPAGLASDVGLVLSLIAFDGVATRESLQSILGALSKAYLWDRHVCVEWEVKGWVDRRILSPMTLNVLQLMRVDGVVSINIKQALKTADYSLNGLDKLLEAAAAWHCMMLPAPLASHVLGIQPMAALPRDVLARGASRLALAGKEVHGRETSALPLGAALDGYFACAGDDRNTTAYEAIRDACQKGKSRAEIFAQVTALVPKAATSGPITSLFALYVLDFVESGTQRKSELSLTTLGKYPSHLVKHLLPRLQGKSVTKMTMQEWTDIYGAIRNDSATSMWPEISAALTSWHDFLVMWLDVPELRLASETIERPPRANYIWPHEVSRMLGWLDASSLDERLVGQIRVAIIILDEARIRASELLNIRLRNVHVYQRSGVVEIEISPSKKDPMTKTPSGRRRVYVRGQAGREILESWISRRMDAELALRDELLFGDPHEKERLYQGGRFYAAINALIKAVTGDPLASSHSFSHTWVSRETNLALSEESAGAINPLDKVANEAGHFGSHTSLVHYAHLFEAALRQQLDRDLTHILITSDTASKWTGIGADALRARLSRNRHKDADQTYWKIIFSSKPDDSEYPACRRRFKTDHLCRLNFDQAI